MRGPPPRRRPPAGRWGETWGLGRARGRRPPVLRGAALGGTWVAGSPGCGGWGGIRWGARRAGGGLGDLSGPVQSSEA